MAVKVRPQRRLSAEELMLSNCGVGESLGLQGDPPSPSKGNQPWIFIGGLRLKLKLHFFGHLIQRAHSLEKTLGKTEGRKRSGQQRMRRLDGTINSTDMSLSKRWEIVKDREAWCVAIYRAEKSWAWLSDWTTTNSVSHFGNSGTISNFFISILFVIVMCDPWSLMLYYDLLKAHMMVFFNN